MPWPPWPRTLDKHLAHYVHPERAWEAAGLELHIDRLALEAKPDGRRDILDALFGALAARRPPIRYQRHMYDEREDRQRLRTPRQVLATRREGTCLDLAILFSGLCLALDLLPIVVVLRGHALVLVSLTYGRKHGGRDAWDALRRHERQRFEHGVLAGPDGAALLRELVSTGAYAAVECTGFAATKALPDSVPEGRGRDADGLFDAKRARAAGGEQFERAERPLEFALDVHELRQLGLQPYDPEGPDAAPRGPSVELPGARVWSGAGVARADYRREIAGLLDFYLETFVGREREWEKVVDFGHAGGEGYLLVEAAAGLGKSAFLVQLVHRAETGAWPPPVPRLAYFFIRREGGRDTAAAFLAAVNAQILDLLDQPGGTPAGLDELKAQFAELWPAAAKSASAEAPLLLVVDGLDEMARAGGAQPTIAQLLPASLGEHARVVVSSRPQPPAGEQVGREHPLRRAEPLVLDTLALRGIQSLVARSAPALGDPGAAAARVLALTRGEPLFARFVAGELAAGGEAALDRLEREPPRDAQDFFQSEIRALDRAAEGDLSWDLVGLLTAAHGGMTRGEMAAALDRPQREVRRALEPIERFLLGGERLELMHLNLRDLAEEEFSDAELAGYRDRLVAWCRGYQERGWPDDTPAYAVDHFATHLEDRSDREGLAKLLNPAWLRRHRQARGAVTGFAADAERLFQASQVADPPDDMNLMRAALALATLGSLATDAPPEALAALVLCGDETRAEGQARLVTDASNRMAAWDRIAEAYLGSDRPEAARRALDQALAAAERHGHLYEVAPFKRLAARLAAAGHAPGLERLVQIAGAFDPDEREEIRGAAARSLAGLGRGDRALEIARGMLAEELQTAAAADGADEDFDLDEEELQQRNVRRLAARGRLAARLGDPDLMARVDRLGGGLLTYGSDLARVLGSIAAGFAEADAMQEARKMAGGAVDALSKTGEPYSLTGVGVELAESWTAPALDEARRRAGAATWAAARDLGTGLMATFMLERAARALAASGDVDGLAELAAHLRELRLEDADGDIVWAALAAAFAGLERLDEAEAAAAAIEGDDFSYQEPAWEAMAGRTAERGRFDEALRLATEAPTPPSRRRALAWVALALARAGRHAEAREAAGRALAPEASLEGEHPRVAALGAAASALRDAPQLADRLADRLERELERIPPGIHTAGLLRPAVQALADVGRFDPAEAAARGMGIDSVACELLAAVARRAHQAGDGDRTARLASEIADRAEKVVPSLFGDPVAANCAAAEAWALAGDTAAAAAAFDGARRAATAEPGERGFWSEQALLARTLTRLGRGAEASALLDRHVGGDPEPEVTNGVLDAVAELRQTGLDAAARRMAREGLRRWAEGEEFLESEGLSAAAGEAAAAGDREPLERALRTADGEVAPGRKAAALARLAAGIAAGGRDEDSWRVFRRAFAAARLVGRQAFFDVLSLAAPSLATSDGGEALSRVWEAVEEVDGWWGGR